MVGEILEIDCLRNGVVRDEWESVMRDGVKELKRRLSLDYLAIIVDQINQFTILDSEERRVRMDEIKQ